MPWDNENVGRLRELWDQGLPTAQIGKLLGFTKNAVVGKAHRSCVQSGILVLPHVHGVSYRHSHPCRAGPSRL